MLSKVESPNSTNMVGFEASRRAPHKREATPVAVKPQAHADGEVSYELYPQALSSSLADFIYSLPQSSSLTLAIFET
jgi:hypothetical protein